MIVLVILEGVVVALLAVLVVGLLRTHAEILRRLHDLGAGVYDDQAPDQPSRPAPVASPVRTQPGVAEPRTRDTPAFDLSGTTPDGAAAVVGVVDRPHTTLLAFLSSGCTTCRGFWDAFAGGAADDLPGVDTHLVVVTKGPQNESVSKVAELARGRVRTVMSSEAWQDYEVPVSPYFVLVDGPRGEILGEGSGTTWTQVAGLLEQACADAGLTPTDATAGPARGGGRSRGLNGPGREQRADEELARAGIGPGHPSLYGLGPPDATPDPTPPATPHGGGAPGKPGRPDVSRRLQAHGLSAEVGGGWEGEIYLRPPEAAALGLVRRRARDEPARPDQPAAGRHLSGAPAGQLLAAQPPG